MHLLVKSPATPRHALRVPDSLGALNRSSSLLSLVLWLVHPIALATGTAWGHGRARHTTKEQACRYQASSGNLRSHREHEYIDGGEEVLDLERYGPSKIHQHPLTLSSVTIVDTSNKSSTMQPAYCRANAARRE